MTGERDGMSLQPSHAEVNALLALYNARRHAEAEIQTRKLLGRYPDFAYGWQLLGGILQAQGKDALPAFRKVVELKPNEAEAYYNIGVILSAQKRFEEATDSFQRAVKLKPGLAEAHGKLGNALKERGRLDEAAASYRRAIKIDPASAEVHSNLGTVLKAQGQIDEALSCYRRAIALKPDFALAWYNLGNAQQEAGQLNEALKSFRRAVEIKPGFAEAHCNLGTTLKDLGEFNDAISSYHQAVEIKPDFAEAYNNQGGALKDLGRFDEAEASYRKALACMPAYMEAYSNLLFLYSYQALIDPQEYLAQAQGWELACIPEPDRMSARSKTFSHAPLDGRRLKVGYVSGDYCQHAVSYFIEQLFAHHDRERIELHAYYTRRQKDAVTERIRQLAEHWQHVADLTDAQLTQQIEADEIDVLIDLSGHSAHNRLGVFARRAAPVQAYYLGYFASTGLTEMDYWIGDEFLTPADIDNQFSEQVWRLPRISWSYDAKDAPATTWQPDPAGTIWIGSFNNFGKLTPATFRLWADILRAMPEGKLLIKTREMSDPANRQQVERTMSQHGIAPDRLDLQSRSATPDWTSHMAYYDRLDIALDPVGAMGGVTTTFDALWMAVPVITLQGDRVASRASAAIVSALGHPEWAARSEQEYVDKTIALARDVALRKTLRAAQREKMASSPLCDAQGLARSMEDACLEMVRRREMRR